MFSLKIKKKLQCMDSDGHRIAQKFATDKHKYHFKIQWISAFLAHWPAKPMRLSNHKWQMTYCLWTLSDGANGDNIHPRWFRNPK